MPTKVKFPEGYQFSDELSIFKPFITSTGPGFAILSINPVEAQTTFNAMHAGTNEDMRDTTIVFESYEGEPNSSPS